MKGTVRFYIQSRGYGWIRPDTFEPHVGCNMGVVVRQQDLIASQLKTLKTGDAVEFNAVKVKTRHVAQNIRILTK